MGGLKLKRSNVTLC
uniref:Uncharacterized protein n=1 Tax=Rhizophora mucronata TaxID=61149 RepID=A0A2P2PA55_RHIMU